MSLPLDYDITVYLQIVFANLEIIHYNYLTIIDDVESSDVASTRFSQTDYTRFFEGFTLMDFPVYPRTCLQS